MTIEEKNEMIEDLADTLFDFVARVSKDETASDAEVEALPEVARVLMEIIC